MSSPFGSTSTASLPPHPCKPTNRSSGGQLGDNEDVGSAVGKGGGTKHDIITHPSSSLPEPMSPCLPFSNSHLTLPFCCCLPTPCRSSCRPCNAAGGPPPLQSCPNARGATLGLAPQFSASWGRDAVAAIGANTYVCLCIVVVFVLVSATPLPSPHLRVSTNTVA